MIIRLVRRIETAPYSLHRGASVPYDQCQRLRMGLAFSKPEDCDRGLDALLIEAREYIGDRTGDKTHYLPAPRVPRRGASASRYRALRLYRALTPYASADSLDNRFEQVIRIERPLHKRNVQASAPGLGQDIL